MDDFYMFLRHILMRKFGAWLLCPLADCPPYELSTDFLDDWWGDVLFVHGNVGWNSHQGLGNF